MKKHAIVLHNTAVGRCNLRMYIQAAQRAGFDGIQPTKTQLQYFLNAGYTPSDIKRLLDGMPVLAVGWLADIDRQGYDYVAMLKEAEQLFALTASIGGQAVDIINGPVDWHAVDCYRRGVPYHGYMGLQGLPEKEQQQVMVKNMRALADLAAQFGLTLVFEPLCWTPIPSLREGIPLVHRVERDNLKIVVDFFHNYVAGLCPEDISRIEKDIILGVHVCNSRKPDGSVPCEQVLRDTTFYEGEISLRDWVQAVKATGFDGWWTYETFSRQEAEADVFAFADYVHQQLQTLIEM